MPAPEQDMLRSAEALRLMRAFFKLGRAEDRRALIEIAERFSRTSVAVDESAATMLPASENESSR